MSRQDPSIYLTAFVPKADEVVQPQGTSGQTVTDGDCASSLAYGAAHYWNDVWKLAENRQLSQARSDAHVLMPGDRLFIPPIKPGKRDCRTDAHYRFKRPGYPEKLCIRLLDGDQPRSDEPYLLRISTSDGDKDQEGTTDFDGKLEEWIPPETKSAILFLHDEEFDLDLGSLQPAATMDGAVSRLVNLCLLPETSAANEVSVRSALGAFQKSHGLDVTYALNSATAQALDAAYLRWTSDGN